MHRLFPNKRHLWIKDTNRYKFHYIHPLKFLCFLCVCVCVQVVLPCGSFQPAVASTNKKQAKAQAALACLQGIGLVEK